MFEFEVEDVMLMDETAEPIEVCFLLSRAILPLRFKHFDTDSMVRIAGMPSGNRQSIQQVKRSTQKIAISMYRPHDSTQEWDLAP